MYNWDERGDEQNQGRKIRKIPEGEGELISVLLYQQEKFMSARRPDYGSRSNQIKLFRHGIYKCNQRYFCRFLNITECYKYYINQHLDQRSYCALLRIYLTVNKYV